MPFHRNHLADPSQPRRFGPQIAHLLAPCLLVAAVAAQTQYWVAANGDNRNPGTATQPWLTITYGVANLAPGDTLRIKNGIYLEEVNIAGVHGLAGRGIVIEGESRSGAVVRGLAYDPVTNRGRFPYDTTSNPSQLFDGIHLNDVSYVTIKDLTVEGTIGSGINGSDLTEITLQSITVRYAGLSGINLNNGKFTAANNVKVLNCTTDRTNLVYYALQGGQKVPVHGTESITIASVPGFEVAYCTVRNSFKEGIDAKYNSSSGKIHHNTVEFTRCVGIYLNEGSNCEVFDNVVRDTFHYQLESGAILRSDQYFGTTTVQPNAYGYSFPAPSLDNGGANGIVAATGDLGGNESGRCFANKIYRNCVYRMWKNGIVAVDSWRVSIRNPAGTPGFLDGLQIDNNTVYDCDNSSVRTGFAYFLDEVMTKSSVRNNVGVGGSQGILLYNQALGTTPAQFLSSRANDVSHNLVWGWSFAAGLLTAEPSTLLADPKFVLVSSVPGTPVDLRLQGSSPACNAGTPVGRPFLGTAPEIGNYEYHGGASSAPNATADGAETVKGVSTVIHVLGNDWDPNGLGLTITWTASGPTNGTVVINADNTITYTPNSWVVGADSFEYGITNGQGGTARARVDVVISFQNTVHYGAGVAGYQRQVPLLHASCPPYRGSSTFREVVTAAAPNSICALLVGDKPAALSFPGIRILVDPTGAHALFSVTDSGGEASFPVPIPWNTTFPGMKFYSQCVVLDPAGPRGFASTSGLDCTIL